MKKIRILIDTNIMLDFLSVREPFSTDAEKIFSLCAKNVVQGFMASISITNAFYVLRKDFTDAERRDMFLSLCDYVDICDVGRRELLSSLKNAKWKDFEDCLQAECAVSIQADYIITRNKRDFVLSAIPAITPQEFLEIIQAK